MRTHEVEKITFKLRTEMKKANIQNRTLGPHYRIGSESTRFSEHTSVEEWGAYYVRGV